MPAVMRTGLALLLVTTFFAASWQLISIRQSWALGVLLLALYGLGNGPRIAPARGLRELKSCLAAHFHGYAACVAAAIVFFAPLLLSNNYGPFTEGGGDVTIYSDIPKLLTDHDMTSFGQPSPDLSNVEQNISSLLDQTGTNRYIRYAHAKDQFFRTFGQNLNPPIADVAAYRTVADIFFSSIFYAPYAQFYFLSQATNYPVYYGVQALFFALMLAGVWYFFRRFGIRPALFAVAMTAASHGLVSVFYNGYSMQGISLSISALMLYLVIGSRIFSMAGLRAFGFGTVIVWLCYTHYVSILAPLLLAAVLAFFMRPRAAGLPPAERIALWRHLLKAIVVVAFGALVFLLIAGGSGKSIEFVTGLLNTFFQGTKNVYLGDRISPMSFQWLSFVFGFVSQQHLQPFAAEIAWLLHLMKLGVLVGIAGVVLGIATLVQLRPAAHRAGRSVTLELAIYALLVVTVAAQMYMAQSSLYTQAKGAQNVLTLTYAAMVLPLAIAWQLRNDDPRLKKLVSMLGTALVLFAFALAIPRAVYTYKLAHGMDRGTILESSYFDEARRILAADVDAFVLFEPRKSADLYVSIQPFSGRRMVPTRHQSLEKVIPFGPKRRVIASDLFTPGDVPHLWTLFPLKGPGGSLVWKSQRVVDLKEPTLYFFGDDYEANFGERPRGAEVRDVGMFTYLRNGAAVLFLPAGRPGAVEVKLAPREKPDYEAMLKEVERRLADGEFPPTARLTQDGSLATLTYEIERSAQPRMLPLARFSGEYWVNVRVDGRELGVVKAVSGEPADPARITAATVKEEKGRHVVRATWSGIPAPHKEDWIGLFPLGGPDSSRIAFAFLGSRKDGVTTIAVPASFASQPLEVRLFRAGSWAAVATAPATAALAPTPPNR